MELKEIKLVVHHIEKQGDETGAEVSLSKDYVDISNYGTFIRNLDNVFVKKSPKMAKFSENGFSKSIADFNSFDLIKESSSLSEKLKDQIFNVVAAKGGYILFCKYKVKDEFLSVFILRNTKAPVLERENEKFVLKETKHLDIRDLAMGAKINLTSLQDNKGDRYIKLIKSNSR